MCLKQMPIPFCFVSDKRNAVLCREWCEIHMLLEISSRPRGLNPNPTKAAIKRALALQWDLL